MPTHPRTLAQGALVSCESETCNPPAAPPEQHPISADCVHPRRVHRPAADARLASVRLVVCDAHSTPGSRFTLHERSSDCVDPIGAR